MDGGFVVHSQPSPARATPARTIAGMTSASSPALPASALEWLSPLPDGRRPRSLLLGRASAPLAATLAAAGDPLVAVDPSRSGLRTLLERAPRALPTVARPERLPFVPTSFDTVWIHQSFHTLTPDVVLPELARVLVPGGHLAISYLARDDSVPWVRRLTAIVRQVDPAAMSGDYGIESVDAVAASPFFHDVESKSFRLWVPIARVGLLSMVAARFPDLPPGELSALMTQVSELYESSARVPDPLLLPYRMVCWRAWVDHDEFTSQLRLPDSGLAIPL